MRKDLVGWMEQPAIFPTISNGLDDIQDSREKKKEKKIVSLRKKLSKYLLISFRRA